MKWWCIIMTLQQFNDICDDFISYSNDVNDVGFLHTLVYTMLNNLHGTDTTQQFENDYYFFSVRV